LYVCNTKPVQVTVYDSSGAFKTSFGENDLTQCHSVRLAYTDNKSGEATVWVTDHDDHTVKQFSTAGELLHTLGTSGTPGSGTDPVQFDQPTSVAISADKVYITDGEGGTNNRVVILDRTTLKTINTIGSKGSGDGQFDLPHGIHYDDTYDRLWVSDEKNARLQVFTADGEFIDKWTCGLHSPSEIVVNNEFGLLYVAQMPKPAAISVYSLEGQTNSSIGECKNVQTIELGSSFTDIGHMMGPGNSPMQNDSSIYATFPFGARCMDKYIQA